MTSVDCSRLDDATLSNLAASGERTALETLLERHASSAVAYACTLLGNREDALDVSQTAMMQLANALRTTWRRGSVLAYLYASVRHAAINLRAQNSARRGREQSAGVVSASKDAAMPGEQLEREESLVAMREEMLELPEETASLLALYHLSGLQVADIARQLKLSVDACKSRLMRGRDELRERLERRGIFLAGVAIPVDSLLEKSFAAGKKMAAQTDAAVLSQIVRNALAGKITDSLSPRLAGGKSLAPSAGAVAFVARPGGDAPGMIGRIVMFTKEHPFAMSGGVAMLVLLVLFMMGPDRTSNAADQGSKTKTSAEQSAANVANNDDTSRSAAATRETTPANVRETKADQPPPAPPTAGERKTLADGNNSFAIDLYARLKANEKGNLFYSPFSISTALGMTYAGARGQTAAQMEKTLHFLLAQERLSVASGAFVNELNGTGEKRPYQLAVANRLFGLTGYPFLQPFLDVNKNAYGAPIEQMDFTANPEGCRKTINTWVEQKTQEKIKDVIPAGGIDNNVRLVLTNAVYFKGDWAHPFDKAATQEAAFHLNPETEAPAPMMNTTRNFKFMEDAELSALEMPYKGEELSMLVLLPSKPDGLNDLERSMTIESLTRWIGSLASQRVSVSIPKFKMTYGTKELSPMLQSLGMTDAFVPGTANFSGITSDPRGMYISLVFHKAFIEVNEEGAEAAAATAVVVKPGAVIAAPPKKFVANHPFLFMIRHNSTGSILFAGRVVDPR